MQSKLRHITTGGNVFFGGEGNKVVNEPKYRNPVYALEVAISEKVQDDANSLIISGTQAYHLTRPP
jgi:hypothetical protein